MALPPFRVVGDAISHDTVAAIDALLKSAQKGEVLGFIYAAALKGRVIVIDATGEMERNPLLARGIVNTIDDRLKDLMHNK